MVKIMKLIVGLGNPGGKYAFTRHNIGFIALDFLAERWGISISQQKFKGLIAKTSFKDEEIILLKPQTFMNLSGESVIPAMQFFKLTHQDILVIHDELDIPFGKIKYKEGGGYAGHNGLKSIGSLGGSPLFNRVRFGIGRPSVSMDVSDYVLSNFLEIEKAELTEIVSKVVDSIEFYLDNGIIESIKHYK